jgi:hypothetical protein
VHLGLDTNEAGTGKWNLRERKADGAQVEVIFSYSDGSTTNTTHFLTDQSIPGTVQVEAGSLRFEGDDRGGSVFFDPSPEYVAALKTLGQPVFAREALGCAIFQVPLEYVTAILRRWPHEKILKVIGAQMFGVTLEDIEKATAENPRAALDEITFWRMRTTRGHG